MGLEEGLHKDLAPQGKHRDRTPGDADAEQQVLETLSPSRGTRQGPGGTGGWASLPRRAGSRERRRRCWDSWGAAEGARGSWGLPGCKRAWGLAGRSRCSGQAPCRAGEEHSLPPSSSPSHC